MGGDFYTYYMLRIRYYDGDTLQEDDCRIDDTIKHHYYPEWSDDWAHGMDHIARLEREYLHSKLQTYKTTILFQEKVWLCSPHDIIQYLKIIEENDIPLENVVFVEKYGDYHRR